MMVIIYFIFVFLAIIGLSEIVHYIQLALLDTKNKGSKVLCCVLKGDKAELDLRYVIEQYNWSGRKYADKIVAINCIDGNKDIVYFCKNLAEKNRVLFANKEDFLKYIIGEDYEQQRAENRT